MIVYIMLISFGGFLFVPSIFKIVNPDSEISIFYNLTEEEENQTSTQEKEVNKILNSTEEISCAINKLWTKYTTMYLTEFRLYSSSLDVLVPPPKGISLF